eukprot:GDKH01012925.1.p2 GENE.GDKH01012925.1~~GDKH01012925.1.p2  ORF type:complete len:50 (+),score=11.26 GDKH01012925.1:124-273(+)
MNVLRRGNGAESPDLAVKKELVFKVRFLAALFVTLKVAPSILSALNIAQ